MSDVLLDFFEAMTSSLVIVLIPLYVISLINKIK
jgi:hypothetical protein